MVNRNAKHTIHHILIESDSWLSGEKLSSMLGISRVSVWKHLQKMKEAGYPLLTSGQGYRLDPGEDTLAPWVFDNRQRKIHYFQVTGSTMDEARILVESGTSPGTLVIAEKQTMGRGRLARKWDSDEGGLYFTIIEYPDGPLDLVKTMNMAAVLSVRDSLKLDYGIDAWCREPNDIWTGHGKIAGILLEVSGEIERIRYVNIGIGINIRESRKKEHGGSMTEPMNRSLPHEKPAVLEAILGRTIKRRDVLEAFLPRYEFNRNLETAEILRKWKDK